jgi:hypothetical protein
MHFINNKFPCCTKKSGLHLGNYMIGDTLTRACPRCGTQFTIKFTETTLGLDGFIKMEWTRCQPNGTG